MTDPTTKLVCTECDMQLIWSEVEQVQDPKPGWEWHQWQVCPHCREADHMVQVCDEPGCTKKATCGWAAAGWPDAPYRNTCGDHWGKE